MNVPKSFSNALPVLKKITNHGYEAYFVGGCVRDLLLQRDINDVDIATSATPDEIKRMFTKTVDVGIEHGTVLVLHEGEGFEITTFRSDSSYTDHRRPDEVTFIRTLEEDLKRRDFTMNAMAMSASFELVDPFQGQKDLTARIIRTVGKATERFQEDALRMIRGARFAAQLDFTIEDETLKAMFSCSPLLSHVAVERKRMEMDKLLSGQKVSKGLYYLEKADLVKSMPYFPLDSKGCECVTNITLEKLNLQQRWAVVIIVLEIEDPVKFLKEWRHSTKRIRHVTNLVDLFYARKKQPFTPYSLYKTGLAMAKEAEQLFSIIETVKDEGKLLENLWDTLPIKTKSELLVNGKDILSWINRRSGPWLGSILNEVEHDVIEGKVTNNPSELKKWVIQWHQKYENHY